MLSKVLDLMCAEHPRLHRFNSSRFSPKNLGRLWIAYTGLQDDFYMLQLMNDDSGHFTQPEIRNTIHTSIK